MSRAAAPAKGSRPGADGAASAASAVVPYTIVEIDNDMNNDDDIDDAGWSSRIIVPPPTANNPLPVLSLAIRVDNREQLLQALLQTMKCKAIFGVLGGRGFVTRLGFRVF